MIPWTITDEEKALAEKCLGFLKDAGASGARITLNKSLSDIFTLLNGELDKVTHSGDKAILMMVLADGKYGSFSTNRFDEAELENFAREAVRTVRMMAPDPCRALPDPSRTAKNAVTGLEMDLYDKEYENMEPERMLGIAKEASHWGKAEGGARLISEECEFSDTISDEYIIDSNGLMCRDIESSFDIGCESTVEDGGRKYSGYWWDSSPRFRELDVNSCGKRAYGMAAAKVGPKEVKPGKRTMVVSNLVSGRLLSPVLSALGGYSIQQKNSFMLDSLGRQIFPKGLRITDRPAEKGVLGSKLYDSEGVAEVTRPIVEDGVVKTYFINTHISGKLGIPPTVEAPTRPCVSPFRAGSTVPETFGEKEIMSLCGDGILVTGFNGGNSNSATGDFSYGAEGFAFADGKIVHPVEDLVITGNFITLWNSLLAAGNDALKCTARQVPTLAFKDVYFSA